MLYFLRHAQSLANRDGIYAGAALNSGLTKDGVRKFTEYAGTNTIQFEKLYVSELSRSLNSGKVFSDLQKNDIEIITDSRINELDFGKLTGHRYITFDTQDIYKKYKIESKESFYNRVHSFFGDIQATTKKDENILIVGHSGVGKMLYAIVNDLPYDSYNSLGKFEDYKIYLLK